MALSKNSRVLLFIAAFLTAISFLSSVSEAAIVAGRKLLQEYGWYPPTPGYPGPGGPP